MRLISEDATIHAMLERAIIFQARTPDLFSGINMARPVEGTPGNVAQADQRQAIVNTGRYPGTLGHLLSQYSTLHNQVIKPPEMFEPWPTTHLV
jgi:hypothetical protein